MANAPAPDWFDSLDANGDGQISQREFPGEPALFQQLDRNADGRLTVQEADRRP
jgi:Ca2+-binding EF-hand superfamily protein